MLTPIKQQPSAFFHIAYIGVYTTKLVYTSAPKGMLRTLFEPYGWVSRSKMHRSESHAFIIQNIIRRQKNFAAVYLTTTLFPHPFVHLAAAQLIFFSSIELRVVDEVYIMKHDTGTPKGCAFVRFNVRFMIICVCDCCCLCHALCLQSPVNTRDASNSVVEAFSNSCY